MIEEKKPFTRQQRLDTARIILSGLLNGSSTGWRSEDELINKALKLTDKLLEKVDP